MSYCVLSIRCVLAFGKTDKINVTDEHVSKENDSSHLHSVNFSFHNVRFPQKSCQSMFSNKCTSTTCFCLVRTCCVFAVLQIESTDSRQTNAIEFLSMLRLKDASEKFPALLTKMPKSSNLSWRTRAAAISAVVIFLCFVGYHITLDDHSDSVQANDVAAAVQIRTKRQIVDWSNDHENYDYSLNDLWDYFFRADATKDTRNSTNGDLTENRADNTLPTTTAVVWEDSTPSSDDEGVQTAPREDGLTFPREGTQTFQTEDAQTVPGEAAQTVPREDTHTDPRGDVFQREDAQTFPREDTQTFQREDAQTFPGADDGQPFLKEDTQTFQREDAQTFPGTNDGQPFPREDTQAFPREGAQTFQAEDTQTFPREDTQTFQREDAQTFPGEAAQTFPREDTQTFTGEAAQTREDAQTFQRGDDGQTFPREGTQTFPRRDSQGNTTENGQTFPQDRTILDVLTHTGDFQTSSNFSSTNSTKLEHSPNVTRADVNAYETPTPLTSASRENPWSTENLTATNVPKAPLVITNNTGIVPRYEEQQTSTAREVWTRWEDAKFAGEEFGTSSPQSNVKADGPCTGGPTALSRICQLSEAQQDRFGAEIGLDGIADLIFDSDTIDELAEECWDGTWCLGTTKDRRMYEDADHIFLDLCPVKDCISRFAETCENEVKARQSSCFCVFVHFQADFHVLSCTRH